MSLEDKIDRLAAAVEMLQVMLLDNTAALTKLRDEVRPKLLRRPGLAAMFDKSIDALRQDLHRGKSGKSELGAKLLELAHVIGGEQVWYPSEIAAHCHRWLPSDTAEDADTATSGAPDLRAVR